MVYLTHFQLMFHFYSPEKHQNLGFSDVFLRQRSGTLVENGLKQNGLNYSTFLEFFSTGFTWTLREYTALYTNTFN